MAAENTLTAPAAAPASGSPTAGAQAPETLIDAATKPPASAAPAVGVAADPAAAAAVPPAADPEWFWSDGVKGTDKPPEWFDAKKYKTVAEQAKAYPELVSKYGEQAAKLKGFAGAPEKYELTIPDTLTDKLEWMADDPLLTQFQTIAREAGMSQPVFEKLLHTFAQYEYANMQPDWAKEKAALGERADERLSGFWDWAGANLDEQTAGTVKRALGVSPSPADVFLALEAVQNVNRQPAIHTPGDDVATTITLAEVDRMQADPRFASDPTYRAEVRAKRAQVVGTGDHKIIVGGAKRAS